MVGAHFTFWEKDWYGDDALMACSAASQMVWFDMCFRVMRKAAPVGHLLIGGKAPSHAELAAKLKRPVEVIDGAIAELEAQSVFSRTDEGVIYCRKMARKAGTAPRVKDEPPDDLVTLAAARRDEETRVAPDEKTAKKKAQAAARARRYRAAKRDADGADEQRDASRSRHAERHAPSRKTSRSERDASRKSVTKSVMQSVTERDANGPQAIEIAESALRVTQSGPFLSFPILSEEGGGGTPARARLSGAQWTALLEEAFEVVGVANVNRTTGGFVSWAPLALLIEPPDGEPCDWRLDVLPALAEVAANCLAANDPMRSWRHPAIARTAIRNRDARLLGLPNPEKNHAQARAAAPARNGRGVGSTASAAGRIIDRIRRHEAGGECDAGPDNGEAVVVRLLGAG